MELKRILLIIPEMSTGGAARSLGKLSLALAQEYKVWIVVFEDRHHVKYEHAGELLSLNVSPGKSMLSKLFAFAKRIRRLRELKRKLEVDVAISFLEGADYINVLSRRKEKVIISVRGSKVYDPNMHDSYFRLRSKWLIPNIYRRADAIVTVVNGIENELRNNFGLSEKRIVTIGNFYDRHAIVEQSQQPRQLWVDHFYRNRVIVTTGRLAKEKGIDGIIRVFALLQQTHNDLRLVIVGDGPQGDELVSLCTSLGLSMANANRDGAVLFVGSQQNVFQYLRGATIYVMNSTSEGFPNGLVEAMICGIPVVAANCPYGPASILDPEADHAVWNKEALYVATGVLMPAANAGSEKIWLDTIDRILNDRPLAESMIVKASERVRDFDREKVLHKWISVIEGVL